MKTPPRTGGRMSEGKNDGGEMGRRWSEIDDLANGVETGGKVNRVMPVGVLEVAPVALR